MTEAKARDAVRFIHIAQVKEDGLVQEAFQFIELESSKLVPFGHEDQGICTLRRLIGIFAGNKTGHYLAGFL